MDESQKYDQRLRTFQELSRTNTYLRSSSSILTQSFDSTTQQLAQSNKHYILNI